MSTTHQKAAYRETAVLGSSPERLVPVLYEHLLINVKRGIMYVRKGDIEGKFESLSKASDIIAELLASLDYEAGGELSSHLAGLYNFWLREIGGASQGLDARRLERVAEMVGSLLEAWEEAARIVGGAPAATAPTDGAL